MKKLKTLIIILVILTVICIAMLLVLNKYNNKESIGNKVNTQEPELLQNNDISDVTESLEYKEMVKNSIINYLYYMQKDNQEAIISICENNNLKFPKLVTKLNIEKIYIYDNIISEVFFVKVNINDNIYNYAITVDGNTLSYNMYLLEDKEMNNIISNNVPQQYKEYKKIENKVFNSVEFLKDLKVKYYLTNIKQMLNDDTEISYNLLENEYKEKRFKNNIQLFNNYKNAIKNKEQDLLLSGYEITEKEDLTQYLIQDINGNQYVYIEFTDGSYKIRLDNYTILDDNFKQKYYSLEKESKVHTNIDIFIKMINSKDYEHAYSKLNTTFASNNFGTVENFKNYIESNLWETNYLEINNIEEQNGIYIVKTTLRNNTSSAAEEKEQTFIVKLGEETNFEMSFQTK